MQNGDKVVYSKYAGTELKVEGADYVLLKVCSPHDMNHAHAASCLATIAVDHTRVFAQILRTQHIHKHQSCWVFDKGI